ncbi:hypothetical protein ABWH96_17170 [Marivirga tractuosa]|uniref:hypothetical protein n=1 Tax=Marivirga tractuosa TaxID=1006 RepID=UPI0035CFA28F
MISKDKIKEINARRKTTKGFSQEDFDFASKMAKPKIIQNKILAATNIAEIYDASMYISTSFDGIFPKNPTMRKKMKETIFHY